MTFVVDANVVIFALIAAPETTETIETLEAHVPTPTVIRDEIERPEEFIVKKSRLSAARVRQ